MNLKILDSWLRDHLKTNASVNELKNLLSLTSASVEKLEKIENDYIYDIEVTTNRVDLMSVIGIAKEANASLLQSGKNSQFIPLELKEQVGLDEEKISIKNDPKLVNRICAAILSVKVKSSPDFIKKRLESSGIRSLNNLIDVTNYVMRETGHPAHVFDLDRIPTKTIVVRESSKGEKIKTLDNKDYTLSGGDIVADDGEGNIIDLLGIMGLANSVVTSDTKKILFFIDNNNPNRIRKTSMNLGIRTEAAVLNEKGVDPELALDTLKRGIELYEQIADAKLISKIYDIYPNKVSPREVTVNPSKVSKIIGVEIAKTEIKNILNNLDFKVEEKKDFLRVLIPTSRINDINIEEDVIEEIARIYGYQKLPSILPGLMSSKPQPFTNQFFWEERVKNALKYWGFSETYTYSMVSADLYEGDLKEAVTISNPLNSDLVYMRKTLVPSLLSVLNDNREKKEVKIFELSKIYIKKVNDLPNEVITLAGAIKKPNASFFELKGVVETLMFELGIEAIFRKSQKSSAGASIIVNKSNVGEIEILDTDIIVFEINFDELIKHATLSKKYKQLAKYPPFIEDLSILLGKDIETQNIIDEIKSQSSLISAVSLLNEFQNTRTFHIFYQDPNKNLTTQEVSKIREKIISSLKAKFDAGFKE